LHNVQYGTDNFPLATVSRPAFGHTKPLVQYSQEILSAEEGGRGFQLIIHLDLTPKVKKDGSSTSALLQIDPHMVLN
jgi:hypothetical protein